MKSINALDTSVIKRDLHHTAASIKLLQLLDQTGTTQYT